MRFFVCGLCVSLVAWIKDKKKENNPLVKLVIISSFYEILLSRT